MRSDCHPERGLASRQARRPTAVEGSYSDVSLVLRGSSDVRDSRRTTFFAIAEASPHDRRSTSCHQAHELHQWPVGRLSHASEWRDVVNPATGEVLASVPLADAAEVNAAVEAAAAAFPEWRRTPPEDRIQPLFKLKMLLEEHIDDIARIITMENGKTFTEAKAEMRRAIENVEVACGIPMMMQGYNLEDVARGIDEMMIRQPLGVVAAIVPFNFPGMIAFWYLPYAIATGNTFILKPSERVPLTMRYVYRTCLRRRACPRA